MFKLLQVKSTIGSNQKIKDNLRTLKLGKIGQAIVLKELDGRVLKVKHLLKITKEVNNVKVK